MSSNIRHYTKEIDIAVGEKIRLLRELKGISQTQLANHVGVRFQQIQKYEKGIDRVSASRLYQVSTFFGVKVSFLFDGVEDKDDQKLHIKIPKVYDAETVQLVRSFHQIKNKQLKKSVIDLLRLHQPPS